MAEIATCPSLISRLSRWREQYLIAWSLSDLCCIVVYRQEGGAWISGYHMVYGHSECLRVYDHMTGNIALFCDYQSHGLMFCVHSNIIATHCVTIALLLTSLSLYSDLSTVI